MMQHLILGPQLVKRRKIVVHKMTFANKVFFLIDAIMSLGSSSFDRMGPGLINLNGRIFALGSITPDTQTVEEYHTSSNSW